LEALVKGKFPTILGEQERVVERQTSTAKSKISLGHDSLQEAWRDELVQDVPPLQFDVPWSGVLGDRRDVERTEKGGD
jgi:hypothetical protein